MFNCTVKWKHSLRPVIWTSGFRLCRALFMNILLWLRHCQSTRSLPSSTTPLLQPMDRRVAAAFRAYYVRKTAQKNSYGWNTPIDIIWTNVKAPHLVLLTSRIGGIISWCWQPSWVWFNAVLSFACVSSRPHLCCPPFRYNITHFLLFLSLSLTF